jgi:restriction endonuclease S subunit
MTKQKILPELRFPEFAEDGAWEEKALHEVSEIITGNTPSTKEPFYYGGEKMFVSPADMNDNRIVSETKTTLTKLGFSKTRQIKSNSVLFVCIGSTIGKISQNKYECATNQQINSLVTKKGYYSDFLYSLLDYNSKQIASIAGNHAVPIINKTTFSAVKLLFPRNTEEQQKIAACLTSLDELIAAHNDKLETLKDHKTGLMQNLFPNPLTSSGGQAIPNYRFPEFVEDGEWVEKIFDDILDITRLAGYEYSKYWKEDEKKEIIALRGYNIGKGTLLLHNLGYISNDLSLQLNRSKLYKGDIVYPCVGTIGNAVVIEEDNKFHIQQNIAKLTPKKEVSPYFISQFLMSHLGLREVNKFNATSSQPNVLVGSLRSFKICIPKVGEQQKIASCLSALDDLITAEVEKIEQLQQHKKGLMQGLFPKVN